MMKIKKRAGIFFSCSMILFILIFAGACSKAEKDLNDNNVTKIAVVRNLNYDDNTIQFFEGVVLEGEKAGYKIDTFVTDCDDVKMEEILKQVIEDDYAGIIISHGKEEYSEKYIKKAVEKGIKVVTFDTVFKTVDGVTATYQDDEKLAELSLNALIQQSENSPAKIIKVWYDENLSPFARRNSVYEQYESQGLIETVAEIYPTVASSELKDVVSEELKQIKGIEADGIWAAWDELAKGVYIADIGIPMVSIDISDEDIADMIKKPDLWIATAAVNAKSLGQINMRIMHKKLKGEQTPEIYELSPYLIRTSDLNDESKVSNIEIEGFNNSSEFIEK